MGNTLKCNSRSATLSGLDRKSRTRRPRLSVLPSLRADGEQYLVVRDQEEDVQKRADAPLIHPAPFLQRSECGL